LRYALRGCLQQRYQQQCDDVDDLDQRVSSTVSWFPVPFVYCAQYSNPAYSSTAVAVGGALKSILDAGKFVKGTTTAATVASQLGELFGTSYMSGTQASLVDIDEQIDKVGLEVRRAMRLLAGIEQLFMWEFGMSPAPPGPHSYTVDTPICHTSWPACTREAVYQKVLQYPMRGHALPLPGQPDPCAGKPRSTCGVPVVNGDQTMVDTSENPGTGDDVGAVVHVVTPGAYTLVNQTLPGHAFHDGRITRTVNIDANGVVRIHSVGDGTGPWPEMNDVAGEAVVKLVDVAIRQQMAYDAGLLAPIPPFTP